MRAYLNPLIQNTMKKFPIEVVAAKESVLGNEPTKINWGAMGSVTIAEAKEFANALNDAIRLAEGGY